jgi:hypothetical protein
MQGQTKVEQIHLPSDFQLLSTHLIVLNHIDRICLLNRLLNAQLVKTIEGSQILLYDMVSFTDVIVAATTEYNEHSRIVSSTMRTT